MQSEPRTPKAFAIVSSATDEQSNPHPSEMRICSIAGLGKALTAKYCLNPGNLDPNEVKSVLQFCRIKRSS